MKAQFYTKLPRSYSIFLYISYIITNISTLGLTHFLFYDFFIEHKYWLNRRILYKLLKDKSITIEVSERSNLSEVLKKADITELKINNFNIWIYNNQLALTLHNEVDNDLIGLFTSSIPEDRMVIKLIRKLNSLEKITNLNT